MTTKKTLRLMVFESSLSNEDKEEMLTMIESATTIDDVDNINAVFAEKVKEIPYNEAKVIAINEKMYKMYLESEYPSVKEIGEIIKDYNEKLIDLWKKGTCPKEHPEKYREIADEFDDKLDNKLKRMELKLQMEAAKISVKAIDETDPETVKKVKSELDAVMDVKKHIKSIVKEMKDNVVNAAKDTVKAAKSKAEELKEKIQKAKEGKAE